MFVSLGTCLPQRAVLDDGGSPRLLDDEDALVGGDGDSGRILEAGGHWTSANPLGRLTRQAR